jgi:rifampicin phosphotransferase
MIKVDRPRLPYFLKIAPERCDSLRALAHRASTSQELADLWESDINPFFYEACHMLEVAAHEDKGVTVFIRQKLPKLVWQEDADMLLTGPVGGLGNLASLGLMQSLTQLARGEITRAVFARTFGHRGAHAFEVSTPRPAEDSNWIDQQLSCLRQDKDNVYAPMARQETPEDTTEGSCDTESDQPLVYKGSRT